MINNAVDFMCSSTGARKRLDVWRGLSHRKCSNEHNKEHLDTHESVLAFQIMFLNKKHR